MDIEYSNHRKTIPGALHRFSYVITTNRKRWYFFLSILPIGRIVEEISTESFVFLFNRKTPVGNLLELLTIFHFVKLNKNEIGSPPLLSTHGENNFWAMFSI